MATGLGEPPSAEEARHYVHEGVFAVGGWREAACGLWHKTLPFYLGREDSFSVARVGSILLRIIFFAAVALFPLIIRKAVVAPSATGSQPAVAGLMSPGNPTTFFDGTAHLWTLISNPSPIDYVLGALALLLSGVPKLLDLLDKRKAVAAHHMPFNDLAPAILATPIADRASVAECDEAIRLTLCALKEELAVLIGDESRKHLTDVTLLEFCDDLGSSMRVRSRSTNHEPTMRPVESRRFVAYYVAMLGRGFAEHDFRSKRNPFPKQRLTVVGAPEVHYRSVLYIPIVHSARDVQTQQVQDFCLGVICVRSEKAYRFWRWGDHSKAVGGFADIAIKRSMPYIALVTKLLDMSAPRVIMEVK